MLQPLADSGVGRSVGIAEYIYLDSHVICLRFLVVAGRPAECRRRVPTGKDVSLLMFWLCCRSLLAHWITSCWADWLAQAAVKEKQEEARVRS